jgi:hypothetical protein
MTNAVTMAIRARKAIGMGSEWKVCGPGPAGFVSACSAIHQATAALARQPPDLTAALVIGQGCAGAEGRAVPAMAGTLGVGEPAGVAASGMSAVSASSSA